MTGAWVRRFNQRRPGRARLFCFAHAGAGASVFRLWPAGLPEELEVCAVQLPGRETRLHEPALTSMTSIVNALVEALSPELDLPFAFFGHSMGAVVASELARKLQAGSGPTPRHLFVSARRAPRLPDPDPALHPLADAEFVAELNRRYGGIPAEVLAHQELMALLLPSMRADLTALETFAPAHDPVLTMPISAFGGLHDQRATRAQLEGWRHETRAGFRLRVFPGDHFFLNPSRAELLADVSASLASLWSPVRAGSLS